MASSSRIFFSVTLVLAFALLLSFTEAATDHLVGGKSDAWKVPSSETDSLNKWAEKNRFLIGDSLVWKYDSKKDSVLQVTREAYLNCNISKPIAVHKEDETKVVLEKAGPYYFISGIQANCDKGEKLIVVVMASRSRPSGAGAISPSLAPAPATEIEAPAVAPTSAASGLKGGLMVLVGVLAAFLMI